MLPVFISAIAKEGLGLLASVGLAKGKQWLSEKTGVDLDKAALSPEDVLVLRQYEMQHEEELLKISLAQAELKIRESGLFLDDVQSARQMQMTAVTSVSPLARDFVYWFAICWSVFAIVYMLIITLVDIPLNNVRYADTVLGFLLGTVIAQVLGFFFGSSMSSQAKDDTISVALSKENTK